MIEEITKRLRKTDELKSYYKLLDQGSDTSLAVVTSARPLMVATDFVSNKRSMLVIVAGEQNAKAFCGELRRFVDVDDVIEYTVDLNKRDEDISSVAKKFKALRALHRAEKKIVVSSSTGVLKKFPENDKNFFDPMNLKVSTEIDFKTLTNKLKNFSYTRLEALDGPGTFCVKGGTIDIFPAQLNFPVRVDFFGDEVEEIRRIVQSTGQTIKPMKSVEIFAAKENEEFDKTLSLQEVLNKKVVVYTDEPRGVLDDMRNIYDSLGTTYNISRANRKTFFMDPVNANFSKQQNVSLVSIMQRGVKIDAKLTLKRPPKCKSEEELKRSIKKFENNG